MRWIRQPAITLRVEGLLDGPGQGPLVPGGKDLSDSPSPHALAQGTDIGRDHRAGVRQRVVEHAALPGERHVGQDHQAAALEEVRYLLLVDEPVDQLDAPRGQAEGKVPDLLEVTGILRLPGDRQVALGEQLQGRSRTCRPLTGRIAPKNSSRCAAHQPPSSAELTVRPLAIRHAESRGWAGGLPPGSPTGPREFPRYAPAARRICEGRPIQVIIY